VAIRYYFFLSVVLVCLNAGCATAPPKAVQPALILPSGACHIVVKGQTLWRIAKIYNVDLQELMRANGITDASSLTVGQRLTIPRPIVGFPSGFSAPFSTADVERIIGAKHPSSHWKTITIHHSATLRGNAQAFNRNHRQRGMGGLFYHFVIGNGDGCQDGEIEVGQRWVKQSQVNRPNDIQVCLVGDFNRQRVSDKQFGSLVKMVAVLRRQYNIPLRNIRKHKSIIGKHTACPGRNFPFDRLILELSKIQT
jgi:LysM repeat protein